MTRVRVEYETTATPEACWALMADFANIDFFNPHLTGSHLIEGSPACGLGTERQCDLKGSKGYFREKVIDWQEGRSYTVDIYEGTLPVDRTVTTLGLAPWASGGTRLYMETDYTPRHGVLGVVADHLVIRRMFRSMLLKVLEGLADKAEAGGLSPSATAAVHAARRAESARLDKVAP
ncbi:MAG: SRPBCC family protein [Devosia sp.]